MNARTPDFSCCREPTLVICAEVLTDRIDTALQMLRLSAQFPGVMSREVDCNYARQFFQATLSLNALHAEQESRIAALVNL